MRHHCDTPFTAWCPAFVHTTLVPGLNPAMLLGPQPGINPGINPGTCLRSHRRHSGNFLAIFQDQRAVWKGLYSHIHNSKLPSPFRHVSHICSFVTLHSSIKRRAFVWGLVYCNIVWGLVYCRTDVISQVHLPLKSKQGVTICIRSSRTAVSEREVINSDRASS